MRAYLLDEALATRLRVEELNAMNAGKATSGMAYERVEDLGPLPTEPIVPGPAASLLRAVP